MSDNYPVGAIADRGTPVLGASDRRQGRTALAACLKTARRRAYTAATHEAMPADYPPQTGDSEHHNSASADRRLLLSLPETARELGISRTARRLANEGVLPTLRLGGSARRRVPARLLEEWIVRNAAASRLQAGVLTWPTHQRRWKSSRDR